ncbi:hypothetical protein D3C78_1016770 [compost metagenome]
MVAVGEQAAIAQGELQVGRVQVREYGLAAIRQGGIVEDEGEQHAHQIDDVRILVAQLRPLGQGAGGFQFGVQARLDLPGILRLLQFADDLASADLLQAGQGGHQLGCAVGASRGGRRSRVYRGAAVAHAVASASASASASARVAPAEQLGDAVEQLFAAAARRFRPAAAGALAASARWASAARRAGGS